MAEKEGSSVGWDEATRGRIGRWRVCSCCGWPKHQVSQRCCYLATTQWPVSFRTLQNPLLLIKFAFIISHCGYLDATLVASYLHLV